MWNLFNYSLNTVLICSMQILVEKPHLTSQLRGVSNLKSFDFDFISSSLENMLKLFINVFPKQMLFTCHEKNLTHSNDFKYYFPMTIGDDKLINALNEAWQRQIFKIFLSFPLCYLCFLIWRKVENHNTTKKIFSINDILYLLASALLVYLYFRI